MTEEQRNRYLDAAYELVDGSPRRTFAVRQVQSKVGLPDDHERDIRQQLADRGLLRDEGKDTFGLTVPAIHQVEQTRVEQGREDEVETISEQRGNYVRVVYDLADGSASEPIPLSEIQQELAFGGDDERRTREYLLAAGLLGTEDGNAIVLTPRAVEWVEGR